MVTRYFMTPLDLLRFANVAVMFQCATVMTSHDGRPFLFTEARLLNQVRCGAYFAGRESNLKNCAMSYESIELCGDAADAVM